MIERIKQFFTQSAQQTAPLSEQQALRLAFAALLLEVTRADFSVDAVEQQTVQRLLQRQFQLHDDQLAELVQDAEQQLKDSVSLYPFTQLINQHYSPAAKAELLEQLWRVAFADGVLDKYEDHLIRTLADLLHLSHSDFIRSKLRVQDSD